MMIAIKKPKAGRDGKILGDHRQDGNFVRQGPSIGYK